MFTNLDLERVIILLLPPHRRKPRFIGMCQVLLYPFISLCARLEIFRYQIREQATASTQIGVLEKRLCDLIDLPKGVIMIGESVDYQGYTVVECSLSLSDQDRQKIYDYIMSIGIVGLQKPLVII